MNFKIKFQIILFVIAVIILCSDIPVFCYPLKFTNDSGNKITVIRRPSSVVSLVPSITDMIYSIGAEDAVKGVTYHNTYPHETSEKEIVGGFFSPSLEKIEKIKPDLIFYSGLQKKVPERFAGKNCLLMNLEPNSVAEVYDSIITLGGIFDRESEAKKTVEQIKEELQLISKKISRIPESHKKRVIRLMGSDMIMTPGDDSFQNEFIRLAGGIPPALNKKGKVVPITKKEWQKFNPEVIYGCGGDKKIAEKMFKEPGWKDVDAVKNGRIYYFPCDLTCRASSNMGYFVSWLAARVYANEFSDDSNLVLREKIFKSKKIDVDPEYISDCCIAHSHIFDFTNKTLIIDFKKPMTILSTLEGQRDNINSVGNHYSPLPCWTIGHMRGLKEERDRVYKVIGRTEQDSSFLFTGADMDNLAISSETFKDLKILALVTAGVEMNAMRMSRDEGSFYEPKTINIILLPNMKLSPSAMALSVISATEAKTAALQDMDIRSSYSPLVSQATGTGTDNIIVVGGEGNELKVAGGHTKLGELVAKAVYRGVKAAVYKQNGFRADRNVFKRLKDRDLTMFDLLSLYECECSISKFDMVEDLENLLLTPRYASFLNSSFTISDDYENGLIQDLGSYELWCKGIAQEIAGKKMIESKDYLSEMDLPLVVKMAVNSLLNGIYTRKTTPLPP